MQDTENIIKISVYITEDLLFLKEMQLQLDKRIKRLEEERNELHTYLFELIDSKKQVKE
jgi:hypothetical protein